jgi:hypothetical protein
LRRLDILFLDSKRLKNYIILLVYCSQEQILEEKKLLLKKRKKRNTTIKNNNDRSGGDCGHWLVLTHGGADGRDEQHNTLESGQKWLELLHMAKKIQRKQGEKKR